MGRRLELTGQKFGRLTVICKDEERSKGKSYWICQCDCGNIKSISGANLRNGATKSCGCLNKEINSHPKDLSDFIGKRFGKLVIKQRLENHVCPSGQRKSRWLCLCDCGNEIAVNAQDLKTGHTKSCGCLPTKKIGDGLIDLIGKRFGKLTVVERVEDYVYFSKAKNKKFTSPRWLCLCDCGNTVIAQGGNLRNGVTVSCGCENKSSKNEEFIMKFLTEHDINFSREFSFEDLRNQNGRLLRFDFAIIDKENNPIILVEFQGEQHYIDCGWFGRYQRNYSDPMKKNYCKERNIFLYEIRYDEDLQTSLENLLEKIKQNTLIN